MSGHSNFSNLLSLVKNFYQSKRFCNTLLNPSELSKGFYDCKERRNFLLLKLNYLASMVLNQDQCQLGLGEIEKLMLDDKAIKSLNEKIEKAAQSGIDTQLYGQVIEQELAPVKEEVERIRSLQITTKQQLNPTLKIGIKKNLKQIDLIEEYSILEIQKDKNEVIIRNFEEASIKPESMFNEIEFIFIPKN